MQIWEMQMLIQKILFYALLAIATFLIVLATAIMCIPAAHAARITDYTTLSSPDDDDVTIVVDVSDTSMSPAGTTKKLTLSGYPVSTAQQAAIDALQTDDIWTLTGLTLGDTHFGAFTGSTIPDDQTLKNILQALETALEAITGDYVPLANIVTTVGDPGSDSNVPSEQAVRELFDTATDTVMGDTSARSSTPGSPAEGYLYWFANTTDGGADDPADVKQIGGIDHPYRAIWCATCDGGSPKWIALWSNYGIWLISREPIAQATYASTGTVSSDDLYGKKLDNYGQSTDMTLTLESPADAETNALFEVVDISNAVYFAPASGEQLLFKAADGSITLLDANDRVGYASGAAIGEEIRITSYQTGASTYRYKIAVVAGTSFVDMGAP